MREYNSNYLGLVINNNDPEFRGRIQVFVPHIMPALYDGWNKEGDNITLTCVGDNIPQGLTSEIADKLKSILPWAEAASPIVGQCAPGGVLPSSKTGQGGGGGGDNTGGTPGSGVPAGSAGEAPTGTPTNQAVFDQSPTAAPTGALPPGGACVIPPETGSVDMKNLVAGFSQRLNGFFNEATSLGYKIVCCSGFRSPEKQKKLYDASKGNGSVAKPGNSAHEYGIAVDLKVSGNGVTIQTISAKQDRTANKDTPAFRALLAKYGLHQPLHPDNGGSVAEKWHIEPKETSKPGGPRGQGPFTAVAQKLGAPANSIETPSSSQMPPAGNPLENKSPSNTDTLAPVSPTTNQIPKAPSISAGGQGISGTISGGGTASDTSGASGISRLAADRKARFEPELSDPVLLDRIEYVINKEGGAQGKLIFETAVNRAFFGNRSLKTIMFEKDYFRDPKKGDPNATKTKPHTNLTLNSIQEVIYNGANATNLATDQAYNDGNLFAKKFIDAGATGDWFDLRNGQKITDQARIAKLTNSKGSGMEEFIYRKDGTGPASSTPGKKAKAYAELHKIEPTTPSFFNSNAPVPEGVSSSELTGKPTNAVPAPATVGNTDPHGPTVVKNTNDAAKGLFAFPGVGAMVWVFFREGNPLFPVYFAASYSSSEWKSAYNSDSGVNPEGTNNGTSGSQLANSMKLNPNAGGGLEFTHVKNANDPSGSGDKAIAMIYGDDGSNMMFSKGYHQIYTRHDRRDQVDGHYYNIVGGAVERWIEDDYSINVRGNVTIKIGKVDQESLNAMKELADFSKQLNDTLMSNSPTEPPAEESAAAGGAADQTGFNSGSTSAQDDAATPPAASQDQNEKPWSSGTPIDAGSGPTVESGNYSSSSSSSSNISSSSKTTSGGETYVQRADESPEPAPRASGRSRRVTSADFQPGGSRYTP